MKAGFVDEKDRTIDLEPRAVAALIRLEPQNQGRVFRRADGTSWHPDTTVSGAQVNRAFQDAAREAGITRRVFLHIIRHSWASWHYAVNKDLKKLQQDGAWESLDMANRYSHLAPDGMISEILAFWGRPIAGNRFGGQGEKVR